MSIEITAFDNLVTTCDSCGYHMREGWKLFVGKPYVPLYLCLDCVEMCGKECEEALSDEQTC